MLCISQTAKVASIQEVQFILHPLSQSLLNFASHLRLNGLAGTLQINFVDLRGKSHFVLVALEVDFILTAIESLLLAFGLLVKFLELGSGVGDATH